MSPHDFLRDEDLAQVLTYVRQGFNNNSTAITSEEVRKVRNTVGGYQKKKE